MRITVLLTTVLVVISFSFAADAAIYKWVGQDGSVHFTDSPPPAGTDTQIVNPEPNRIEGYGKVPERKPVSTEVTSVKSRSNAAANLPMVEMFVTSWCGYCKKAEAYFRKRNIPFVKYDIEKDQKAARRKSQLTTSRGVPFVLIGDVGIPGYSEAAFERALMQYQ